MLSVAKFRKFDRRKISCSAVLEAHVGNMSSSDLTTKEAIVSSKRGRTNNVALRLSFPQAKEIGNHLHEHSSIPQWCKDVETKIIHNFVCTGWHTLIALTFASTCTSHAHHACMAYDSLTPFARSMCFVGSLRSVFLRLFKLLILLLYRLPGQNGFLPHPKATCGKC